MPDPQDSQKSLDFEEHDFNPNPRSPTEYLAALWQKVNVIDLKVTTINGRVGNLEKFMWALGGGTIVIAAIAVPQFLGLLK